MSAKKTVVPEEPKIWKPGLFDFIDAIGNSKRDLISEDPEWEKEYNPYMINTAFSLSLESLFYAAEMNRAQGISKKMQHDFYLHSIPAKKRFNKWPKKAKNPEETKVLAEFLGCSMRAAASMVDRLTPTDLKMVTEGIERGGKNGRS